MSAEHTDGLAGLRVAVVGGGITGLVAARRLVRSGAEVTVIERSRRFGGQLVTVDVGGLTVDVGAEALHLAATPITTLLDDLGLTDELVPAADGPTWLQANGQLRPLPAGFGPAGPSRLWPLVTSRILSPRGIARAACEPLLGSGPADGDEGVGTYLERQFGSEMVDRLVDPLLGALHAGDVRRLSLQAATPHLAAAAARSRSLVLGRRGRRGPAPAGFATLRSGMQRLVEALVDELHDATLMTGTTITSLVKTDTTYRLLSQDGHVDADRVVIAVPPRAAAALLRRPAPDVARKVAEQTAASVAVAVHTYPAHVAEQTPALAGTGVLVGSRAGRLLKAATFLSTKWPHLADDDRFLVRLSAGRADDRRVEHCSDQEISAQLHADLRAITGLRSEPIASEVHRWPAGMPQLEVGHGERLRWARTRLASACPGIALAGAAYDGVGISACIASGERAADRVSRPGHERVAV